MRGGRRKTRAAADITAPQERGRSIAGGGVPPGTGDPFAPSPPPDSPGQPPTTSDPSTPSPAPDHARAASAPYELPVTGSYTVSVFLEKGFLSIPGFILAGDNLIAKCPSWFWRLLRLPVAGSIAFGRDGHEENCIRHMRARERALFTDTRTGRHHAMSQDQIRPVPMSGLKPIVRLK
uniref:Uncharacterized protein n=1 Tax=Zea mays TaxID=4577 RepID=A0A804QVG6_MAIZE